MLWSLVQTQRERERKVERKRIVVLN
jgi:hypothetical protein